ncbi:uncharacterized protein MELLADRAFT_63342 [Melampsora larici-populina 98AG31]|uniref:Uncharacterized protein n=1 Tax=Melampsora larici-populina (strain 98AG31 / pathotype 3-4-7) TaxID=747676 RepID=F4RMB5_MELLP|nr:uncharacterized protein MELLADRAFT_63342 [Melampsora larici-populina 98AG31]EGG06501.1 hypothetical protein MELLADRAFT_63342 [Melampsora larici-populina 98AG31]
MLSSTVLYGVSDCFKSQDCIRDHERQSPQFRAFSTMDLLNKKSYRTMALMLNWPILLTAMGVWDFSRSVRHSIPTSLGSHTEARSHLEETPELAVLHQEDYLSERQTSDIPFDASSPSTALASNFPAMYTGPHQSGASDKTSFSSFHSLGEGNAGILNTHNGLAVNRRSGAESQERLPLHQVVGEEIQSHVFRPGSQIVSPPDAYILNPPSSSAHMDISGEGSSEQFHDPFENTGYYRELSHVISQLPGIMEDSPSWHGQLMGLPSPEMISLKPYHEWRTLEAQNSPTGHDHPVASLEFEKASPDYQHAHHRKLFQDHSSEELPSSPHIPASDGHDPSTALSAHTSPFPTESHHASPTRNEFDANEIKYADDPSNSEGSSHSYSATTPLSDSHDESSEESSSHFLGNEARASSALVRPPNARELRSEIKSPGHSTSYQYVKMKSNKVEWSQANSVEQNSDQEKQSSSSQDAKLPSRDVRISLSRPGQLKAPHPTYQVNLQRSKRTYHHDPFSFNGDDESTHQATKSRRLTQTKIHVLESSTLPSWQLSWSRSKPRTARGPRPGNPAVLKSEQPRIDATKFEGTFDLDRYYSKKNALERSYSRSRTLARSEKVALESPTLDRSRQARAMNIGIDFQQKTISSKSHLATDPFLVKAPKPSGPMKKRTKAIPRLEAVNPRPEGYVDDNRHQLVSNSNEEPLLSRALMDTYKPQIQKFLESIEHKEANKDYAQFLVENMEKLWDNYLEMITICSEIVAERDIKTNMEQDLIDAYKWIAIRWKEIPGTHFDWLPLPGLKYPPGKLYERDAFTPHFETLPVYEGTIYWLGHRMFKRRRERVAGTHILYFMREKRPHWIRVLTPISAPELLVKTLLIAIKRVRKLTFPSPRP